MVLGKKEDSGWRVISSRTTDGQLKVTEYLEKYGGGITLLFRYRYEYIYTEDGNEKIITLILDCAQVSSVCAKRLFKEATLQTAATEKNYGILSELLAIVDNFGEEGLSVHLVSMAVSQYKALDGYGKDKKKRATKLDTVPEELISVTVLKDADDIRRILPFSAGERLCTKDISKALGLTRVRLWKAIKFLTITEILTEVGKKGNGIIYEVTPEIEY